MDKDKRQYVNYTFSIYIALPLALQSADMGQYRAAWTDYVHELYLIRFLDGNERDTLLGTPPTVRFVKPHKFSEIDRLSVN